MSHCPVPPLADFQIAVSPVGAGTVSIHDPGATHRRGIVVMLHPSQSSDLPLPLKITSYNEIGLALQTLQVALNTDGWIFALPAYPPNDWSTNGIQYFSNLMNDCASDPANGARMLDTLLLWWDHMVDYLVSLYGAGRPIVVFGFSLGGWAALQVAVGRTSSLVGYIAHCPATVWSNIFSSTTAPADFTGIDTSGMDLSTTALNPVAIPGLVGASNNDADVGWTNNTSQTSPMPWTGSTVSCTSSGVNEDFITGAFLGPHTPGGVRVGCSATVTSGANILAPNTVVNAVNGDFMGVTPNTIASGVANVQFTGPLSNTYPMVVNAITAGRPVTFYEAASSTSGALPEGYPIGHLFLNSLYPGAVVDDGLTLMNWVQSTLDPHYAVSF